MERTFCALRTPALCTGALLVGLGSVSPGLAIASPIPIEQFVPDGGMQAPSISPDGSKLVYITTSGVKAFIIVEDLLTGKARPILQGNSGRFTVSRCDFKNDERLLCRFGGVDHDGGDPYAVSRLVAVNADGSAARVLLQNSTLARSQFQDRILHWLPNDPHKVLIALDDEGSVYPAVYRLDIYSGTMGMIVGSRQPITDWVADRDGVVRFGSGYLHDTAQYVARNGPNAPWHVLEKFKRFEGARFSPLAFGSLSNQLFVTATNEHREAIWEMDLDENSDFQLVYSQPQVDVTDVIEWPTDGHIAGFAYDAERPHAYFIDPQADMVEKALERVLPGAYHSVIGGSRDGKKLLCASYSDVLPLRYDLLDLADPKITALGRSAPALVSAQLAPMKPIVVPGPGGIQIPGYLTLPVGAQAGKKLPTVVFPHGGPYYRDSWGYDPMVQVMASRGYAVLQLNFRGSTGYGHEWLDAGHQAWGTVMHDDITAGARWVIDQGIADPARMCIVGWSYGGYAALTGVEKEPQLYKCAVSIAGVTSLGHMIRDDDRFYGGREAASDSAGTDRKTLKEESPVEHAERIKVPVLLVHGSDDYTVLVDHSKAMAKALTRSGVPNELVIIKQGEHSLLRNDMRITLYNKLVAFLAANLDQ
jgi:dipeptidyl aminopeptidase/acylaminoacyl peptidase